MWTPVDGWADPAAVFAAVVPAGQDAVLLESTSGSGCSWIGLGSELRTALPSVVPIGAGAIPSFEPGWMGWLTYEGDPLFLTVDRAVGFDHDAGTVRAWGDESWVGEVERAVRKSPGGRTAEAPREQRIEVSWRHDDDRYLALLAECAAAIRRGDAYVLCLTNTATAGERIDAWASYLRLRASSPTHSAGFLRLGGTVLVSASPERFLEIAPNGAIRSRPIKGTRPRFADPRADAAAAAELQRSDKERAENLMIVDLVRNDLSRVAVPGSVRVPRLFDVESYAQVHQLVSEVEGTLRTGVTSADAIVSLFPAGSMTGAPKRSAMDILSRLEEGPRGLYSGAFGYVSHDGSAELAMVIRSIVVEDGRATIGSGGGVTALSEPADELAEVRLKAAPLIRALQQAR